MISRAFFKPGVWKAVEVLAGSVVLDVHFLELKGGERFGNSYFASE